MLIRALTEGHWVLVDHVNFCNPSVLDRLNALLEPQGKMAVNECGLVDGELRIVDPHPNFRLFLVYDPEFGEVSNPATLSRVLAVVADWCELDIACNAQPRN